MKKVLFLSHAIHRYRKPFHDQVRKNLASEGVDYIVGYGDISQHDTTKQDTTVLSWALSRPTKILNIGKIKLFWQPFYREARSADLVILSQENKYVLNYIIQLGRRALFRKVALWGHGRNFQARDTNSTAERWKRFWAIKADWWFGYTEETSRYITSLGFPRNRITVFNNSVDTSELQHQLAGVTGNRLATLCSEMRLTGRNVGIFVGGIYPDKRMSFLIEAADHVRSRVPDFELIIIGAGSDLPLVQCLAEHRSWICVTGPRFGQEKVELMRLGHVFMMPGLMGLAILDAGVVGLPVATTAFPWHSPEIAYLQAGYNGVMVEEWENPVAYGNAVTDLLRDVDRRQAMGHAARDVSERFSIQAMAENFSQGVLRALEN